MSRIIVLPTDAANHVDVMRTFMAPDGGLPVADGHQVVPIVRLVDLWFPRERRVVSREEHHDGHISFASSYVGVPDYSFLTPADLATWDANRIRPHALFTLGELAVEVTRLGKLQVWPDHGQAGTPWCRLHPDLDEADYGFVQVKGDDPLTHPFGNLRDGYGRPTPLHWYLQSKGIKRLFITGLALDYCVLETILDAIALGYEVVLVLDGTRAVSPEGYRKTLDLLATIPAVTVAMSHEIGP